MLCNYKADEECDFNIAPTAAHLSYHISNSIPSAIPYDLLSLIPARNWYRDPTTAKTIKAQLGFGRPILFLPTSISENPYWEGNYGNSVKKYAIYMFGILPCGSKTAIVIKDAPITVDVKMPVGNATHFDVRAAMIVAEVKFARIEEIDLYPLHGFNSCKLPYRRIYFVNLEDRAAAIKFLSSDRAGAKLELAGDDSAPYGGYFNKVAREFNMATAGWNRIEKYKLVENNTQCEYLLEVSINDLIAITDEQRESYCKIGHPFEKIIDRDPTIIMQWDIETYGGDSNGGPPVAGSDFIITTMNSAYFWQWSDRPLVGFGCTSDYSHARKGVTVIVNCDGQEQVLRAHMEIAAKMRPDITSAFNGGHFDWPRYIEKVRQYGLLFKLRECFSNFSDEKYINTDEKILKYSFKKEKVKIDAENVHELEVVATFPGILDTDVMPVFLTLYPRNEVRKAASLNFFLAKNDLPSKEDMNYRRMFMIHERAVDLQEIVSCHCDVETCPCCAKIVPMIDCIGHADESGEIIYGRELHEDIIGRCCFCGKKPRNLIDISDVVYYCMIDCVRPQQLYVKRMIVQDKRELSTMAHVSLYDSFYRANGMKVRNFVGIYCHKNATAFPNGKVDKEDHEKDHYPGAYVFAPHRGLHSDGQIVFEDGGKTISMHARPIFGDDFNSLYPSEMMTYNLSPDMIIKDETEARRLIAAGYTLHRIKPFKYERGKERGASGNQHLIGSGWTVRHNGVFVEGAKTIERVRKFVTYTYNDELKTQVIIDGAAPDPIDLPERDLVADVVDGVKKGSMVTHTTTVETKCEPTEAQQVIMDKLCADGFVAKRTVNYKPVTGRDALPGERMGITPLVVKQLFDQRVPVKARWLYWAVLLEDMKNSGEEEREIVRDGIRVNITLREVEFNVNFADARQKALKLLANTTYGDLGNFRSSLYQLLVAASITCGGQDSIKLTAAFAAMMGYTTHYGDTDSVYLSPPDHLFAKCDAEYYGEMAALALEFDGVDKTPAPKSEREVDYKRRRIALREIWWTEQVKITMKAAAVITEKIYDMLILDNGTLFLKTAYEEVLFPCYFTGRKKYLGQEHKQKVTFNTGEVFIKGIDIIKQGQAGITKELGMDFMRKVISTDNEFDPMELTQMTIRTFYEIEHDTLKFRQTGRYKIDKKGNVSMHTFHRRMTSMMKILTDNMMRALYEPPESGDKFDYVVVKKPQRYKLTGTKIKDLKGDLMEYYRVYKASQSWANPMELDLNYYMIKYIVGLFARFLSYYSAFQPATKYDVSDKKQYKLLDKVCITNAKKFLNKFCESLGGSAAIVPVGTTYLRVYNAVSKQVHIIARARLGESADVMYLVDCKYDTFGQLMKYIETKISIDENMPTMFVNAYSEARPGARKTDPIYELDSSYASGRRIINGRIPAVKGTAARRIDLCREEEAALINDIRAISDQFGEINMRYEQNLEAIVDFWRKHEMNTKNTPVAPVINGKKKTIPLTIDMNKLIASVNALNTFSDEEEDIIHYMYALVTRLISVRQLIKMTNAICEKISMDKNAFLTM